MRTRLRKARRIDYDSAESQFVASTEVELDLEGALKTSSSSVSGTPTTCRTSTPTCLSDGFVPSWKSRVTMSDSTAKPRGRYLLSQAPGISRVCP